MSSGSSTTTTDSTPWEGQQSYLLDIFGEGESLFNDTSLYPEYYTGETVAQATDTQSSVWDMNDILLNQTSNQNYGAQTLDDAQLTAQSIMSGDYLNTAGTDTLTTLMETGGDTTAMDYATSLASSSPGTSYIESAANAVDPSASTIAVMANPTGYITAQDALSGLATGESAADAFSEAKTAYSGAYGLDAQSATGLVNSATGTQQLMSMLNDTSTSAAQNYLGSTASGDMLNSNPWLDDTYNAAADSVIRSYQTATAPTTDSTFSSYGRTSSGAHQNAVSQNEQNLSDSLTSLASEIYGDNYANERELQLAAVEQIQGADDTSSALKADIGTQLGDLYSTLASADTTAKLGAAEGYTTIGSQDLSTRSSAASSLASSGLSAVDLQSDIFNNSASLDLAAGEALNTQSLGVGDLLNTSVNDLNTNQLSAATAYNDYTSSVLDSMVDTIGLSTDLSSADWTNLTNASTIAAEEQAQAQSEIDADVDEWNYNEELYMSMLDYYSSLVNGSYGNYTVSTTDSDSLFCWVARAVFGEDNPLWLRFRTWMLTQAPARLRDLYGTVGPSYARWLAERPAEKARVKTIMLGILAEA